MPSRARLSRWLVASGIVSGIIIGISVGINPGSGGSSINLTAPWAMHPFVAGVAGSGNPDGADGVYLADFDGDGLLDAVIGHEQGTRVTLSFHPGAAGGLVEQEWPTVILPTVNIGSVEDAIACDVDQDGALDIVTAAETGTFRVEVIFAPAPPNTRAELLNAANWTRVSLDDSAGRRSMRAQCADIAGDAAPELIVGGKDDGAIAAEIGYYDSATPRTGSSWAFNSIMPVGWVMQMLVLDINGDGNLDIYYTDRTQILTPSADGTKRGVRVLLADAADPPGYTEQQIIGPEGDHKWGDLVDWDGDTDLDVVDCHSNGDGAVNELTIAINNGGATSWTEIPVTMPSGVGQCQMVTAGDLDQDGVPDLVVSYFNATNLSSVIWMRNVGTALEPVFQRGEISGILDADSDVKMDNLILHDVDGDGDLDAVNTEQHVASGTGPGLGGIYFENPRATFIAPPVTTVTCSLLTSGTSTTDATSIATAAITPGANRPVLAAIVTTSSVANQRAPSTVTGAGLSLTQLADQAFTTVSTYRRLTVWEGVAASPTTEAVTFDFGAGGNLASWGWAIVECAGGDPADPSLQTDIATVAAGTSAPTALAALDSANSAHVCIVGQSVNSATAVTPDAQFAELAESAFANGSGSIEVAWANDETGCDASWGSADAAQLSIEVATP